jgi:hypothetical protein
MDTETTPNPVDERKALRAEYEKLTGAKAVNFWNADDLRSRITVARAAKAMQGEGPAPLIGEDRVNVVITADPRSPDPHVFLPLQEWHPESDPPRGVVPDEWKNVPGPIDSAEGVSPQEKMELAGRLDTKPVPDRAHVNMPRSCADMLVARKRCVIIGAGA